MRWPTFRKLVWMAALVLALLLAGALGVALRAYLGIPKWVVVLSPLLGTIALFGSVWLLVRLDDLRRRAIH